MTKPTIVAVTAREIVDCRLEPTLRVTVETNSGVVGQADVPAGRSTGVHEATELRDGDERYDGKGVKRAVENVEEVIAPALRGMDPTNQSLADERLLELDGTPDKSCLGGNALTGTSLAVLKAGANASGLPLYRYVGGADTTVLPIPLFDMIEGGELASTDLAFQEHQVLPVGASSFSEALRMCAEVYYELADVLREKWGESSLNVGYEGGYTPTGMTDPRDAFDAELKAIGELGYEDDFALGLDIAASHFYDPEDETYELMNQRMSRDEMIEFYEELTSSYPLVTIEDPLEENDFEGCAELTRALDVQVIGDDLFVTSPDRLEHGIREGVANSLLLKVNQVGTVTESLKAADLAMKNGYTVQVSERSGQTADTWLADLAVGLGTGQIKTGVSRSERTEQYNRLLRIEDELGNAAIYPEWREGYL
jgi:enolase